MKTWEDYNILFRSTLEKHGPYASNKDFGHYTQWSMVVCNGERRGVSKSNLGWCSLSRKEIGISSKLLFTQHEEQIIDTILHECAHALAGNEFSRTGRFMSHGKLWKSWARMLGADPKARVDLSKHFADEENPWHQQSKFTIITDYGTHWEKSGSCKRKLKNMSNRYMRKDKKGTYGKLWLIETTIWEKYKHMPYEFIKRLAVR